MVIGIDTYHDSSRRGRSVAGFVASLNATYSRYFTNWSFQEPSEELQSSLGVLVRSMIISLFFGGSCDVSGHLWGDFQLPGNHFAY